MNKKELRKYEAFGSALMALRDVDVLGEGEFDPEAEHVDFMGSEEALATIDFMYQSGDAILLVKLYRARSPLGEFKRADIIVSDPGGDTTHETVNVYTDADAAELRNLVETEVEVIETIG